MAYAEKTSVSVEKSQQEIKKNIGEVQGYRFCDG